MITDPPRSGGSRHLLILFAVALPLIVADQLTKAAVVGAIAPGERVRVVGDLVQLWHLQNSGAAFSILQGRMVILLVVSAVALALVGWLFWSWRERSAWLHVILGMVLGGAVGNLVDRVRQGYVVDFISVGIGDLRWPSFNIADASLVVGIGLLLVAMFVIDMQERRETPA